MSTSAVMLITSFRCGGLFVVSRLTAATNFSSLLPATHRYSLNPIKGKVCLKPNIATKSWHFAQPDIDDKFLMHSQPTDFPALGIYPFFFGVDTKKENAHSPYQQEPWAF
jgi:hypothetical protein